MSSPPKSTPSTTERRVDPPGWNDPPMLGYNQTNPPPKSRITNKRVAFPLCGISNLSNPPVASPGIQGCFRPPTQAPPPPSKEDSQ